MKAKVDSSSNKEKDFVEIVERFSSRNYSGFLKDSKSFLKLIATQSFDGTNEAQTRLHVLARDFLPYINKLMKLSLEKLSDTEVKFTDSVVQELVAVVKLCVTCLRKIKRFLKGQPFLVEIQRYNLLRRLVSLKMWKDARKEVWGIISELDSRSSASKIGEISNLEGSKEWPPFPLCTEKVKDPMYVSLLVGACCSLVACFTEEGDLVRKKDLQNLLVYLGALEKHMR